MKPLVARVAETISRYNMLARGQRVGVAVSGGADSLCLLHVLRELSASWELTLSVLHVDHGIRGEASRQDALFVRQAAGQLGIDYDEEVLNVPALAVAAGENLEQAARRARQAALERLRVRHSLDRIALGHTLDDQAETVLARLLRGSGPTGLAGIYPVTEEGIVRPLIELRREEVRAWLGGKGIRWREDATNEDLRLTRNRIRRRLLPLLEVEFNPQIARLLAQTAHLIQGEESFWEHYLNSRLAQCSRDGAALIVPVSLVRGEHPAAARRLLRRLLRAVKGNLAAIEFQHVESLLGLALDQKGGRRVHLPGVVATRSMDWIRLEGGEAARRRAQGYCYQVTAPGIIVIPEANLVMHFERFTEHGATPELLKGYNQDETEWDEAVAPAPFTVRNWRPGDRYQPRGGPREAKLKELLEQARVPCWERRVWPIICCGDRLIWSRRFGVAAAVAASETTKLRWRVRVEVA